MVYAAIGAAPRGADVADLDLAGADRSADVVNVIAYDGVTCDDGSRSAAGIAVIARGYWLARKTWPGCSRNGRDHGTRASGYVAVRRQDPWARTPTRPRIARRSLSTDT